MKNLLIYSAHNVYEDDFNEGEKEQTNFYECQAEIRDETIKGAIEKYISDSLGFTIKENNLYLDEEQNLIFYDTIVNNDNFELSKTEHNQWKKGKMKAYTNRVEISVSEITPVKLNQYLQL
jgi:hypothetical protein